MVTGVSNPSNEYLGDEKAYSAYNSWIRQATNSPANTYEYK